MDTPWNLFGVEHGPGWSWITTALLQKASDDGAEVFQVKEKFGGLRFYYDGGSQELSDLVEKAEWLAEQTCELCGEPGKLRNTGWMITACDKHAGGSSG